jgi:hypothetical protein
LTPPSSLTLSPLVLRMRALSPLCRARRLSPSCVFRPVSVRAVCFLIASVLDRDMADLVASIRVAAFSVFLVIRSRTGVLVVDFVSVIPVGPTTERFGRAEVSLLGDDDLDESRELDLVLSEPGVVLGEGVDWRVSEEGLFSALLTAVRVVMGLL